MTDLFDPFADYVDRNGLIAAGDRVLAGLSGGADSVAMLDLLLRLAGIRGFSVAAAHFNHRLREKTADRDERFSAEIAARAGIPYHADTGDVRRHAADNGLSIEAAARELRMRFFYRLLSSEGYTCISLGHHADDQAETVIMNLMRGSGPAGLGGIKPRSSAVIHPMLALTRGAILAYTAERGLSFMTDETNAADDYLRNRIRHRLIPAIRETFDSDPVPPLCRTASILHEVDECLLHLSQDVESTAITTDSCGEIMLDIDNFMSYLKAVQKRFLIRILTRLSADGHPPGYQEIDRVWEMICRGASGSRLELTGGVTCVKSAGRLAFRTGEVNVKTRNLAAGSWYDIPECGFRIRIDTLSGPPRSPFPAGTSLEFLDGGLIEEPLVLRAVRPGDRFVPLGMNRKKKIQDFFTDEKIPVFQRDRIPVLTSGSRIVWVVGCRIDDRFKITESTTETLKAEIVPLSGHGQ
ncbi:tRNA lysidine(34) synthetase TilS [bacterium]|nr:tRNA lysidine(34) synthetase TilS [bacterium]